MGIGVLEGPGTVNWNAGIAKYFPIHENVNLRFEATATDALNHPNLGVPDMNPGGTPDFAMIHAVQAIQGTTGARTVQLGLRLTF